MVIIQLYSSKISLLQTIKNDEQMYSLMSNCNLLSADQFYFPDLLCVDQDLKKLRQNKNYIQG